MSAKTLVPSFLLLALSATAQTLSSSRQSFSSKPRSLLETTNEVSRRAIPSDWTALGCYSDSEQRTMTGMFFEDHTLTSESCIAACSANGYSYAGTQYYFQCFCSNSLATTGHTVGASDCNTPCDGNKGQTCGGPYRLSVFQKQTTTTTATLPSGWSVDQVCVEDSSTRIMQGYQSSSSSNTPASCAADCSSRGYSLAGVQNGNECYCANAYTRSLTTKPSSDCSTPCTGDSSQTCGGGWRMATYKSSSSSASTATSTTSWTLAHACLVDSSTRVLTTYSTASTTNTPASCTALCASKGYTIAGLEDGRECYCASSYNTAAGLTAGDGCTTPCTGDSTQMCGGGWRIAVYQSPSYVPPTTTPATIPSDWSLIHMCAVDGSTRLLGGASTSSSLNTPAWCVTHCRDAGFTLAGVEYGQECHCSNAFAYTPVDASSADCNMPCAGDSTKTCGAGWRVVVYGVTTQWGGTVNLPLPEGGKAITQCVNPNHIALTFDDGPYHYLHQLSDMFTNAQAKATFFFNGNNYGCIYSSENVANIKYAYAAGHEMASHTWAHLDLTGLTYAQIHDEMYRVELALSRIVGVVPAYVRPPFGNYNSLVQQVARERGQAITLWSFDSLDWQVSTQQVFQRYDDILATDPVSLLILHHETYDHTPLEIMPTVIQRLQGLGYELVTVSECMGTKAYQSVTAPATPDSSWTC